ncbi:class I SAM-dependent methyltransferase [Leptospira sp. FAT2]|uniref:class I SAM-dependent methyltransferase n=1 Tax=Leptospira sanjuanensis TaxID=2879643 RepID=UPI001EE7EABE|nr:class I SAM-dependent methyltransferase [Leptospira sanjuanensis]MCG6167621.1 class I SAM-dependent methyltransferase [Leptospira sanjuanensis]MCG6193037.1 class I SAM-dependent methyltransferase [Leptospira sanjuanensis]
MISKCPICDSDNKKPVYELFDDRYGFRGFFKLYICSDCKHKFLENNFSNADLTKLYSDYYPRRTFDVNSYRPLEEVKGFRGWLSGDFRSFSAVPKCVRVLDIGCGFCESLGYHQSRGCEVYGVEADKNATKVADRFGFNVHIGTFDETAYPSEFFDYVTMDQVIEHVIDPVHTLKEIHRILKKGGRFIATTPNSNGFGTFFFGRKWINWHTPYHLHHFSKKSIYSLASRSGFRVESLRTLTSSEWFFYQWIHSSFFPKEGEVSSFWSPNSKGLSASQQKRLISLQRLKKLKLNSLITRIFDSIGFGDNWLIYFAKE